MEYKIYLAPIKGITDRCFRKAFAESFEGVDFAISPFITSNDSFNKLKDLSPESNIRLKTVPQVLTRSPEVFISLAEKLYGEGCNSVNLNLGCPFKKVLDKGEGAALLPHPEKIEQLLDRIFDSDVQNISVKMRLGMNSDEELIPLLETLNRYPLNEIFIHARTAGQMYDGDVNIPAFMNALKISKNSIIYNGDITHFTDIENLSSKFGKISGYMIGRGLLVNPFLSEEIRLGKKLPDEIKLLRLKNFTENLFSEYESSLQSPAHVLDKMKELWFYLSQGFENGSKINKKIRKIHNVSHYLDEVKRIFNDDPVLKNQCSKIFRIQ